jgi:single-stranded-DNA-specific exonuclease
MEIVEKSFSPTAALGLIREGASPLLARVLAARQVRCLADARPPVERLLPYSALKNAAQMGAALADAIEAGKRLLILADYDADGATACAVGMKAMSAFGANVGYLIPDRLEHGYGLTPGIVRLAAEQTPRPEYIITVDNGIASHEGIEEANRLGIPVLVTDHHLPKETHPDAELIVNPNQHGCDFPSKAMAGCGVMYYVMWALQDELVERGYVGMSPTFHVTQLLPIVAIGTVADVVALDTNNRVLVNEGLRQLREGGGTQGIRALAVVSGKVLEHLSTTDIAFGLGPRINAAGRLESMDAGVECLLCEDELRSTDLALALHEVNERRKEIESDMTETAIRQLLTDVQPERYTAVLHAAAWHIGVIGIVAGRIKEKIWRPTFVLADGNAGEIKGSGRSIPGFNLKDALDLVDKRHPGVLLKFGGHAMAAGVTVAAGKLEEFREGFEKVARELLSPTDLAQQIACDGGLSRDELSLASVAILREQVWGQAFPEPFFVDTFRVIESRALSGGKHLKMTLEKDGFRYDAIKFRHADGPPPSRVKLVYRIGANTFRDETKLQLLGEILAAA